MVRMGTIYSRFEVMSPAFTRSMYRKLSSFIRIKF